MGKGSAKGRTGGVQKTIQKKPMRKRGGKKIDSSIRYAGTVKNYDKLSGYGFISTESGVVDGDEVFVHWKSIQSEDRFPFLYKGLEVEFSLREIDENIRAWEVTAPGGEMINIQDENDANKKTFIGSQDSRYKGTLKFLDTKEGFGYITIKGKIPGVNMTDIRVERSEVNYGGVKSSLPNIKDGSDVEFGVWVTPKGAHKAYNMTLPGGLPFTRESLEHRVEKGGATYQGEVSMWNWQQGWGFIHPTNPSAFPPAVKTALQKQAVDATNRAKKKGKEPPANPQDIYLRRTDLEPGTRLSQGNKVKFSLYTDDRGVGACNLTVV